MRSNNFTLPDFPGDDAGTGRSAFTSRRDLLESSRLSKLPSLESRSRVATSQQCKICNVSLDQRDDYQTAVEVCRVCLKTYAAVGAILEKYTEQKIRRNYMEAK